MLFNDKEKLKLAEIMKLTGIKSEQYLRRVLKSLLYIGPAPTKGKRLRRRQLLQCQSDTTTWVNKSFDFPRKHAEIKIGMVQLSVIPVTSITAQTAARKKREVDCDVLLCKMLKKKRDWRRTLLRKAAFDDIRKTEATKSNAAELNQFINMRIEGQLKKQQFLLLPDDLSVRYLHTKPRKPTLYDIAKLSREGRIGN